MSARPVNLVAGDDAQTATRFGDQQHYASLCIRRCAYRGLSLAITLSLVYLAGRSLEGVWDRRGGHVQEECGSSRVQDISYPPNRELELGLISILLEQW